MEGSSSAILVLGATGKTGRLVVEKALAQGYRVTVLVRNASVMQEKEALTIVQGTPTKLEDIQKAMRATNKTPKAIISTLGQTRQSGNPWSTPTSPPKFIAEAVSNCIRVAREAKIPKLVIMSAWGTGASFKSLSFVMRFVMSYSNMAQTYEDHDIVDKLVKDSGLTFVLPRATLLKGDGESQVKYLGDEGENAPFMPSISSRTVAKFLVDAVATDQWDGRTPVISS